MSNKYINIKETIKNATKFKRNFELVNVSAPIYYDNKILMDFDKLLEKTYNNKLDDDYYNKAIYHSLRYGVYISFLDVNILKENKIKINFDNKIIIVDKSFFNLFRNNIDYGIKVKNGVITYGFRYKGPKASLNTKFVEFNNENQNDFTSINHPLNQYLIKIMGELIVWESI